MNKDNRSIKELCEFIWYLEEEYKLFELKVNDVFIWEYVRMQVYYKIAASSKIISPHIKKTTLKDRILLFLSGIKNIFKHNFWSLKSADIVIMSHPRSVLVSDEYIDIYSEYFIREISSQVNVIDFESEYQGKHIRKRKHNVHFLDWVKQYIYVKYFFIQYKKILNSDSLTIITKVEKEIFDKYKIDINLKSFIETKVKLFNIYFNIYNKIFKKVSPQKLYLVVAYNYAPIIKAAKHNNIKVKEFQHGVISKYHLGYSYPSLKNKLHYFPDKLLIWSAMWRKAAEYPISDEDIIVSSFKYLERTKNKYKSLNKINNQYLILSQTAISDKICKKILKNKEFFYNKKIIYKLHPFEFDIWEDNKWLLKLRNALDVEIIGEQRSLYELMATSEYQVGVFSTALYEGVEFGCKTILLNVDGIEYMESFINMYNVQVLY